MSIQLDDGQLKCLPHPAESGMCENEGLTLAQASERGRLFRETFFVCRNCGKDGETMAKQIVEDSETFTVRGTMEWGWGAAAIVVPLLIWMRWWQATVVIGTTLLVSPAVYWRENRKIEKALAARGFPRADAPGRFPIAEPTAGCRPDMVIGQPLPSEARKLRATGPCCDRPDWTEAFRVKDEDHIPCATCGCGIMVLSEHSIH